jgi:hypothetical protein
MAQKPPSKANEKKFSLSTPFGTEIRQRLNGRKNKTKQKKKKTTEMKSDLNYTLSQSICTILFSIWW